MFYSCVTPGFRDDSAFRFGPSLVEPYSIPAWLRTPPLSPSSSANVVESESGSAVDEPSNDSSIFSSSESLDASDDSFLSEARSESPFSAPLPSLKPELVSAARRIHRLLTGLPRALSVSASARRRNAKPVFPAQASKDSGPRKSRGVNVLLLRYLHLVAREPSPPVIPVKAAPPEPASPYIVDGIFLELLPSVLLSLMFTAQRSTDLEHMCTSLYLKVVRKTMQKPDPPTGLVHLTSLPLSAILLTFCLRSTRGLARWFVLDAIDFQVGGVYLSIAEEGGLLSVALAVSVLDLPKLELFTIFVGYFENGCGEEAFYLKQVADYTTPSMVLAGQENQVNTSTPDVIPPNQEAHVNIPNGCLESTGGDTKKATTENRDALITLQQGSNSQGGLQQRSASPAVPAELPRRRRAPGGDAPTISTDARKLVNEAGVTKDDQRRHNKLRKPRKPFSRPVSPRPVSCRPLSPRPLSPRPLSPRPPTSRPLSPRPTSSRPISPVASQLATYKVIRLNIQFAPLRLPADDAPPAPAPSQPAGAGPQRRGVPSAEQRAERKVVMAGFKAAGRKWKGKLKGKGRGMGMSRFARMSAETRVREAAARSRPTSPRAVAGPSRHHATGISQRLGEPAPSEGDGTPARKQKVKWGKYVRKSS